MAHRSPLYGFEWVALASAGTLALFYILAPVWQPFWIITLGTLRLFGILVGISLLLLLGITLIKDPGSLRQWRDRLDGKNLILATDYLRMGIALAIVETTHFIIKTHIPLITPLNYDSSLWRVDRWIFLGFQPEKLAGILVHSSAILKFLDLTYSHLYYLIVWGSVILFLTALSSKGRLQFMTSFCLFWQVGLILYILLPSWGPVFTHSVLFRDALVFMPHTYHVQSQLWQETIHILHRDFNFTIRFFGCAAFPSLHVGVLFLYTLWSFRLKKIFRWIYFLILIIIVLGSVVTGYHYVVDIAGGFFVAWFAYRISIGRKAVSHSAVRAT